MKQLAKKNYEAPLICTEDLQVTGVLCQSTGEAYDDRSNLGDDWGA